MRCFGVPNNIASSKNSFFMQQKNITTKAFSPMETDFRRMALILSLVIYMLHVGGGQFQGMDEEMMKKMGDLYGFPVGGPGQQLPGQAPPGEGALPGQRTERQGQGGAQPNQGQWNPNSKPWPDQGQGGWPGNNAGSDQGWPSGNQGQGQPWGNQGQAQPSQEWPDQGQPPANQGQQPGSGPGGSPLDQQPGGAGGGRPQGPDGSAVNTGPAGQKLPNSNYDMAHGNRPDNKHHKHGSLDVSHPRAPKPKSDYIVKVYNGSIHSRSVGFST